MGRNKDSSLRLIISILVTESTPWNTCSRQRQSHSAHSFAKFHRFEKFARAAKVQLQTHILVPKYRIALVLSRCPEKRAGTCFLLLLYQPAGAVSTLLISSKFLAVFVHNVDYNLRF